MKALRLHADMVPGTGESNRAAEASKHWKNPRVNLEEIPAPQARNGELLLEVAYCGLCGSDYHLAEPRRSDKRIFYPGLAELPVTIGHEFSARVVGHGPGVSESAMKLFPLGTIVTAEEMLWCGECAACRAGHLNHCENLEELGFTRDGAHAELVRIHSKYCWSLSPLLKKFSEADALRLGALVEPYSVSYRALFQGAHAGKWLPGNSLLIFGAGPIGLAALDLALAAGASEVKVVEEMPDRRKFALSFGASQAIGPEDSLSDEKFDWIIDAAGTARATELAAEHLNIGGTLCLLARVEEACSIYPEKLITKNSRVFGSQGHSGESAFPRIISMFAAGKLNAIKMIQEEINLEQAEEKLQKQKKCSGKTLVLPGKK